jgi:hypothetical protein
MVSPGGAAELGESRALLAFDGDTEDLVVQIDFSGGGAGGLAWLMAFPSAPHMEEADPSVLASAFEATEPPARSEEVPGVIPFVCACGASQESGAGGLIDRNVIGNLELVTLGGDFDDVRSFVRSNGFMFHDRQEPVIESYLAKGWVLVAARIRSGAAAGAITPVRFSFPTDTAVYPTALAGADHGGPMQTFDVATITPWKPDVTTFPMRSVRPDDDGYFPDPDGVELRYAAPLTSKEREDLAQLSLPDDAWLGRIDAGLDPEALTDDLVVAAATDETVLDYTSLLDRYRTARYAAYGGRVAFTFLLVTPFVLFFAGAIVILGGVFTGGFRSRSA